MLSILMPAFNAEKYLPDTLKSLLEENKDDFEIVICDDGSTEAPQRSRRYLRLATRECVISDSQIRALLLLAMLPF
jgi:glycosyltransferase involved in cell wall biosynthesis